MHKGNKLSSIILIFSLLGLSQSLLAQDKSPQVGTWAITEEINGKPGRGFQVDVQNDIVVLYFYGYADTGESTFWLASGRLAKGSNTLTADLGAYKGGMAFGDSVKNAVYLGGRGQVTITFDDFTSGEICLPDEPCKPISAFNFGYEESASELLGSWVVIGSSTECECSTVTYFDFTQVIASSDPAVIDSVSGIVWWPGRFPIVCDRLVQPNPEPYSCAVGSSDDDYTEHFVVTRNGLVGRSDTGASLVGWRVRTASGRELRPD